MEPRTSEGAGRDFAVGIANNGQYGFHARRNGELGLSLVRGAIHCRLGDKQLSAISPTVSASQHHTYMDQGHHEFRFRLIWGRAAAVARALIPAAHELNLPLEHLFIFNQPTPEPANGESWGPFLELRASTVVLSCLKKADRSDDLIVRVNETIGRRTKATLRLAGASKPAEMELRPFEVRTMRLLPTRRGVRVVPCGLLED